MSSSCSVRAGRAPASELGHAKAEGDVVGDGLGGEEGEALEDDGAARPGRACRLAVDEDRRCSAPPAPRQSSSTSTCHIPRTDDRHEFTFPIERSQGSSAATSPPRAWNVFETPRISILGVVNPGG